MARGSGDPRAWAGEDGFRGGKAEKRVSDDKARDGSLIEALPAAVENHTLLLQVDAKGDESYPQDSRR